MATPRSIHKFILGEGFRLAGAGEYWKFIDDVKPVAWVVCVKEFTVEDGKFFDIFLRIGVSGMYLHSVDLLCTDGLLRPEINDLEMFVPRVNNAESALEILSSQMWRWLKVISSVDVMVSWLDFRMGLSPVPPSAFDYLADYFDESAKVESFSLMRQKLLYLMASDRYNEAENVILNNKMLQKWKRSDGYQFLLNCAKRRSLVTDEFAAWVDKKKLAPNRKW